MEERIRKAIGGALEKMGAGKFLFAVERPSEMSHGDYATNAALVTAKLLKRNPSEIAHELAQTLTESLGESAANVTVAGPGFVNITLSRDVVTLVVAEAGAQATEWGKGIENIGQRIMVEYSSPNAFKEMHVGHLVGTIVGESLSRLVENAGAKITRDTFGGDIGPNVAKALWALRNDGVTEPSTAGEIGVAYTKGATAYESDPKAKAEIDVLNQSLYAGSDSELMEQWRKGRDVSVEEFQRIWKLLGTHFDYEFFDSDTVETAVRVTHDGLEKGIFKKSDGAIIYDGEAKGVHTMVFLTSHNTPTYEAKDLGLAFLKEERWPSDKVIVVTGNEQRGRFQTVLAALSEIAPQLAKKTEHVVTGFLRLSSGKMSSREGNAIPAADFIREVITIATAKNPDPLIARDVALGAIKYMILRQAPGSDIVFDEEKSLSLEGDSGPYLQYALVRAKSVIAKASTSNTKAAPAEPALLERIIVHYPQIVARAARELAPNLLVNYLTELASEWNSYYAKERIIGGEFESHKLLIARAFVQTMTNGLTLLGIPTPEKM